MMVPDAQEVDDIIVNVAKELNADEVLVARVLGRISQFASYSQIPEMKVALENIGTISFYSDDNDELNLNQVFGYLKRKKQFPFYKGDCVSFMADFDNLHLAQKRIDKEKEINFVLCNL